MLIQHRVMFAIVAPFGSHMIGAGAPHRQVMPITALCQRRAIKIDVGGLDGLNNEVGASCAVKLEHVRTCRRIRIVGRRFDGAFAEQAFDTGVGVFRTCVCIEA